MSQKEWIGSRSILASRALRLHSILLWPSVAAVAGALWMAPAVAGQSPAVPAVQPDAAVLLRAAPATGKIHLDGRLQEEVWEQAPIATGFVQRRPRPGLPATEGTEVRVLYGENAIYIGARLYDTPDSIAAQLGRRDAANLYSDWIIVALDSYYDRRTAFVFGVNPRGVRQDFLIANDAGADPDWDAVWDAAARIDSLGWTAEFRIPLSQLRFTPGQDVWGVNFQRIIARRDEVAFWSPTPPETAGLVSQFGRLVGLSALTSPRRLQIQPYAMARASRAPGNPANPFYRANDGFAAVGGDLQYGLSSNLTLTGTINPDFGQVEADPSVVNLTAFETFFPEKRPFFLEGEDLFDFGLGDGGRLFYSRRIGREPQGRTPGKAVFEDVPESTTILGAVKLSGKTPAGWSVGFLNALTEAEDARFVTAEGFGERVPVEPLTNYSVLRTKRDFRRGQSALGGILTSTYRHLPGEELSFLRSSAYAGGMDGRHRFGGGEYEVSGWAVGSHLRGTPDAIIRVQRRSGHYFQRPDAHHLEVDSSRTSLSGVAAAAQVAKIAGNWRWQVDGSVRTPGFDVNDLGYLRRADLIAEEVEIGYRRFRPGGIFRRWTVSLEQSSEWTFGGERLDGSVALSGEYQLKNHWTGLLFLRRTFPSLSTSELRGGPALRTTGAVRPILLVGTDRRKPVNGDLLVNLTLRDEGGRSLQIRPRARLRPSSRLELSLAPSIVWNRRRAQYIGQATVEGRRHYFLGHLDQTTTSLTARLGYSFTPDLSLELYAQPYISAASFSRFLETRNPRAGEFDERFRELTPEEVKFDPEAGRYRVDVDGDGSFDTTFRNPHFNLKELRSNMVLRWEYRPGSTLFVVWNQERRDLLRDGSFALDRDLGDLLGAEARHVLLVKLSYWMNF